MVSCDNDHYVGQTMLIIIKQMVNDLNLPIKVISHPIVREKSGLAMSSRNLRLSTRQRETTNKRETEPTLHRRGL